ncbi:MAG: FKBP-type peptidyl-prolyl cis-trans isomerase [Euryarchaeota archaeon]|nr:FKBP-type peptidyl-prolyl cis-trans isomerase [Euryarchaeota archaeon]
MAEETTPEPQVEKQKKTDKTGLAILALTVIIVAVITVFLVVTYYPQAKVIQIQEGDCIDLNYIGRYASNNTIFDSSYNDTINKTGGTPLNVFISQNKSTLSPVGYENYSQGIIDGLMEGLVNLKEGQTTTIGPIPPEKAYGTNKFLTTGDIFTTKNITASTYNNTFNLNVQVVSFTEDQLVINWINPQTLIGKFTMPEDILLEDFTPAFYGYPYYNPLPPYSIWENASEVENITDNSVMIKTTPTAIDHLTKKLTLVSTDTQMGFVFPDATTATWNDTMITLTCSLTPGTNYTFDYSDVAYYNIIIDNLTVDHINITVEAQGQSQSIQINRTIEFNRTYAMRRLYTIPSPFSQIFLSEITQAGYSMNKLADEALLFEVTIEKVYKTSE